MTNYKDFVSFVYYLIGGIAFVLVLIRLLYSWFRDFDNSQRFTQDMALVHLPHIYLTLEKIGDKLGIDLDSRPPVNFSTHSRQ